MTSLPGTGGPTGPARQSAERAKEPESLPLGHHGRAGDTPLRLRVAALALAALATVPALAGVPAPHDEVVATRGGHLAPCGRALCESDGTRFRWRGVTGFALLDLVADGHLEEARAFMQWARDTGFTVIRVLAMLPSSWLDLSAEDGRRALTGLFALAREYGVHVQVVALANTVGRDRAFLLQQVREVGRLCAADDRCVLEIANEPYHPSQAKLQDQALMKQLAAEVPAGVPVAWGAAADDTSDMMAGGSFVVAHVSRGRDRWARVARMRELERLSAVTGKFVVDNEPIGAAEADERGRRDAMPAVFFAQGVLSRMFEVGSTFHCEDCLRARVPGPIQQRSARAFVQGATVIPDAQVVAYKEAGTPDSPLRDLRRDRSSGFAFAGVAGDRGWLVLLDVPKASDVRFQGGWRRGQRADGYPPVEVWTIARSGRASVASANAFMP